MRPWCDLAIRRSAGLHGSIMAVRTVAILGHELRLPEQPGRTKERDGLGATCGQSASRFACAAGIGGGERDVW
jgi:hypothetical protein